MAKADYEKGTIKVVWVEKDIDSIYSKMFDDIHKAEEFGKEKKNYIIFALVRQKKMAEFSWKLLPYGKHRLYKLILNTYKTLFN